MAATFRQRLLNISIYLHRRLDSSTARHWNKSETFHLTFTKFLIQSDGKLQLFTIVSISRRRPDAIILQTITELVLHTQKIHQSEMNSFS